MAQSLLISDFNNDVDQSSNDKASLSRAVRHYDACEGWCDAIEPIVGEDPLTVYINGAEFATVVCSPWNLEYMAVGFLCSEGILRDESALTRMDVDEQKGIVSVEIEGFEDNIASKVFLKRYINSCCGRSRASFYYSTDAMLCKEVVSDICIDAQTALYLVKALQSSAHLFRATGGVHCGLLACGAKILQYHEDIGRNNVLDRIYGQSFLEGENLGDKIVTFSGRVSSEIVLKMSKMGIPILVSRSAPTALALTLGDELGITICGFVRQGSFNLYTHPERLMQ